MNSRKFIKTATIINRIAMIAMIIIIISLFGVRDKSSQAFLVLNTINTVVDIIVIVTAIINIVGSEFHRKFYEKANVIATNNDAHTMFPWSNVIVNILFISNDFTERELKVIEAATRFLEGIYLLQKMDIREVSFDIDDKIPMMIPSQILSYTGSYGILTRLKEGHYIGEKDLNRVTYALIIREMHLLNTYEASTDNPETNFYDLNKTLTNLSSFPKE